MQPSPPQVLAPVAEIATVGGRTILLLTVELWRNQICLHLAGQPTWRDDPDRDVVVDPTADHGTDDLGKLGIQVSDDVDTQYRRTSGHVGGTDTEWRAEWYLRPGVPPSARRLLIRVVGEQDRSIELPLAARSSASTRTEYLD